ncbi:hypothetical protein RFI_00288 [Reticulomyxa filosa]|uniref:Uncharacterized protein n=1 Tax=Reticulomyxa filosa TaxID=46433 RepID=X6PFD1_RETFI|nr:hypothetical protein RFI_00288 [Reticulomyxa filosa]|eukprot:ETO36774.1 hypothetical protein RFI_00288 [Reticulomyxa filosa]
MEKVKNEKVLRQAKTFAFLSFFPFFDPDENQYKSGHLENSYSEIHKDKMYRQSGVKLIDNYKDNNDVSLLSFGSDWKGGNTYTELQLINIKDNVIKSDEDVKKEFESNEHIFKIIWTSFQQPVILKNVKKTDVINFRKLFEQELKHENIAINLQK